MKKLVQYLLEKKDNLVKPGQEFTDSVNNFDWVCIINSAEDDYITTDGSLHENPIEPIKYTFYDSYLVRKEIFDKIKNNQEIKYMLKNNEWPEVLKHAAWLEAKVLGPAGDKLGIKDDAAMWLRTLNNPLILKGDKIKGTQQCLKNFKTNKYEDVIFTLKK